MNFMNKIVLIVFALSLCLSACSPYVNSSVGEAHFNEVKSDENFGVHVITDSVTGCKLYASSTYGGNLVVSQKFRADGKPDCPNVQ